MKSSCSYNTGTFKITNTLIPIEETWLLLESLLLAYLKKICSLFVDIPIIEIWSTATDNWELVPLEFGIEWKESVKDPDEHYRLIWNLTVTIN